MMRNDAALPREQALPGPWRFLLDADDLGESESWYAEDFDRAGWMEVPVPAPWDRFTSAMWSAESVGWYATEIPGWTRLTWQRLRFGRVMIHARAWLNGQPLGEHLGGYTPFEFAATPHLRSDGPNHLVLRVDNRYRPQWLPAGKVVEWVQYGGILQPVTLLTTERTWIDACHIAAEPAPHGNGAQAACTVRVASAPGEPPHAASAVVTVRAEGETVTAAAPVADGVAQIALRLPHARFWSPDTPVLYGAEATLSVDGAPMDAIAVRFGVRRIEVRGAQLLLNGEPIYIRGASRYDEYDPYGPVVPEDVLREDLLKMKRLGMNTVRNHYPQDPLLPKLLDEIGMLLMVDVPLCWWRIGFFGEPPELDDEDVLAQAEDALDAMVKRDFNHPSIFLWSMANECGTDSEPGISAMRRLIARTRALDPTRLVTFVANHDVRAHLAFDACDLLANNLYFGLFGPREQIAVHIGEMDAKVRAPLEAYLRDIAPRYPDQPIIVTEFGARSIAGLRGDAPYTEEHHAAWLEAAWQAITAVPGVAGGIIWCWADYWHQWLVSYTARAGPVQAVTAGRQAVVQLLQRETWRSGALE
jgi:beta-glucuronidase